MVASDIPNNSANGDTQASAPVDVALPPKGSNVSIPVMPGAEYKIDAPKADFAQDGTNLVIKTPDNGDVVLQDYFLFSQGDLPPQIALNDGKAIEPERIMANIGDPDLNAIETAAGGTGGGGGGAGGGAAFSPYGPGGIGDGLNTLDLLGNLDMGFYRPEVDAAGSRDPDFALGSVSDEFGQASFGSMVSEDLKPTQHTAGEKLAPVVPGELNIVFTPHDNEYVVQTTISGFPDGMSLELTNNAAINLNAANSGTDQDISFTGGSAHYDSATQSWSITIAGGLETGIKITGLPHDSDADIQLSATVDIQDPNSGRTATLTITGEIVIDAVADKPENTTAVVSDSGSDEHVMTSNPITDHTDSFGGGYNKITDSVTTSGDEGKVSVTFQVTATFGDYTDGSEAHFVLVQKLPGFVGAYETETVNSVEYFKIPVDDAKIDGNGKVTVDVTLQTPQISGDTTLTLQTGAMAVETPSDRETDLTNNVAYDISEAGKVQLTVDVIDSKLEINVGWASEGNAPDKNLASGQHTADYSGQTIAQSSTSAGSAPITISITGDVNGGSPEHIVSIQITDYDTSRGTLTFNGAPVLPGQILNFTHGETGADLVFKPSQSGSQQYNDADVQFGYKVTVANDAGASATYTGHATVVIDAVADLSTTVTADSLAVDFTVQGTVTQGGIDASGPNLTTGLETDTFTNTYAPTEYSLSVGVSTTFPDTDGSEKHYILVEKPAGWTLDVGALPSGYSDAGTHAGSDGKTYFKIEVKDPAQGSVTVDIPLKTDAVTGDMDSVTIKTGSLAVEQVAADREYDKGNNVAERLDGTAVKYSVDVINSTLTVTTGWASEGNNDAKHLGLASTGYEYTGTQAGSTSTGVDHVNNGAPIHLSIGGGVGSTEAIDSVTFTYDGARGALEYTGPGTATFGTDANGNTTLTISGINSPDLGDTLIFKPVETGPQSYNDDDVHLGYKVTVTNDAGASATFDGSSTVVIDAVADRSSAVASDIDGSATVVDPNPQAAITAGGADAAGPNLVTGLETDTFSNTYAPVNYSLSVSVSTTFPDTDGSEKHYILVEQPAGWTLGALPPGYSDAGPHTGSDGKTYFKIEVTDPTQGSVNVDIPLKTSEVTGDMGSMTIKTGSLAVEQVVSSATDREYDTKNNSAERLDGTAVSYKVDVINSTLTVKTGWASEGNNDAKHLGLASTGYEYTGTQAGSTSQNAVSHANNGAPIQLSISGGSAAGSAEVISSVTFTYDSARGTLEYTGPGTVSSSASGGVTTYKIDGVNSADLSGKLVFKPAATSNDHSDVHLDYKVTVTNTAGASATFDGSSTVVIDAVADKPTLTGGQVDYNINLVNGAQVEQTAAKPNENVTLSSKVTFPDITGGEVHYVLVETGRVDGFTVHGVTINGDPVANLGTPVAIGAPAVEYYKIPVSGSLKDFTVEVNVSAAPTADKTYNVSIGGQATVAGSGLEYDTSNNTSTTVSNIGFNVAPANSGSTVTTVNTYESSDGTFAGINENKHRTGDTDTSHSTQTLNPNGSWGTVITYGTVATGGATKGDIKFTLTNSDSVENITELRFTIQGDLNALGTLTFGGVALTQWNGVGAEPAAYYTVSGGVTSVVITDTTPSDTSITVKYIPGAYSDTDLVITGHQIDVINSKSYDTATITGGGKTVIVDSIAARAQDLAVNDTDYKDDQTSAKLGEAVTVNVTAKVPELGDANEKHSLLLQAKSPNAGGTTLEQNGTIDKLELKDAHGAVLLTITFENTLGAGQPGWATPSGITVEKTIVDGVVCYKISGPAYEAYLHNADVNGNVNLDLTSTTPTAPSGSASADGGYTFWNKVGVMAEDKDSDVSVTPKNDVSVIWKNYGIDADIVVSKIEVGVGKAYENADRDAHQGFIDRASQNLADLKADSAEIKFVHTTQDANEKVTQATFTVDYPNSNDAPGQFMYKDVLIGVPSNGTTVDGNYTCTVDANGKVTITIENFDPGSETGGWNLYFVPGENYHSADVELKYAATVTDGSSGQEKIFTNDTGLLPSGHDANNSLTTDKNDGLQTIEIDAVAQKVDITDTKANGAEHNGAFGAVDADHDGRYDKVVPGEVANVTVSVNFHGDVTDGSEHHYLFVEMKSGWNLVGNGNGGYTLVIDGVSVNIPASSVQQQFIDLDGNGAKEMYWKIEVPNSALGSDGAVDITFPIKTPAGVGSSESLTIGAGSLEDINVVKTPTDGEITLDNNKSFSQGSVTIDFDTSKGSSIGSGGYFEREQADANKGDDLHQAAVAINIVINNPYDAITNPGGDYVSSISIGAHAGSENLGTLYVFETKAEYQDYLSAYNEYKANPDHVPVPNVVDYGAVELTGNTQLPTVGGSFNGQVVFVPTTDAGQYHDQDFKYDYSITVKDTETGHTAPNNGVGTIIGDAVAQKPTDIDTDEKKVKVEYGEAETIRIEGTFTDVDGSTNHYVLVEVEPNWTLSYVDANGHSHILSNADIVTPVEGGPSYYKIPVNDYIDQGKWTVQDGVATGSVNVTMNSPSYAHPNIDSKVEFKTGGLSVETDLNGKELTYHNNSAFTEGPGVNVTLIDPGHPGGQYYVTVTGLYENNTPDAHIGDDTESFGQLAIGNGVGSHSVVITIPSINGVVPAEIVGYTGTVNPDGSVSYTINKVGGSFHELEIKTSDGYKYQDADFSIKFEYHAKPNGAGAVTGSGSSTVIVDAVAQQGSIENVVNASNSGDQDKVAGALDDHKASFEVTAKFEDFDKSENHYILVEQIPGWTVDGAKDVVSITQDDGSVKSYYRVDVSGETPNANGEITIDVTLTYDSGMTSALFAPNKGADGVWEYKLGLGTMAEEKNIGISSDADGTKGGLETRIDNNTAINIDGEAIVKYSTVDSSVSVSVPQSYEQETDGNAITVHFTGVNANMHDVLENLTFTYVESEGTLLLNGVKLESGDALTGAQLHLIQNGGVLTYEPNAFEHGTTKLSWTSTVTDTVSGDSKTTSSFAHIVIDAVAHGNVGGHAEINIAGETGTEASVTSGERAVITVQTDFIDTANASEEHYVVLSQDTVYKLDMNSVTLDGVSVPAGDIVIKLDSDGNPYYAVKIPAGVNGEVSFTVTTPTTEQDINFTGLKAGTISVDVTRDGEITLNNNWKENIDQVTVRTGVATTEISVIVDPANNTMAEHTDRTAELFLQGSGATGALGAELTQNGETVDSVALTITQGGFAPGDVGNTIGTIEHDGQSYDLVIQSVTGSGTATIVVTIPGANVDPDTSIKITLNDSTNSSDLNVNASVTVKDQSGETKTTQTENVTVVVYGTATMATNLETTNFGIVNGVISMTLNARFADNDGSENHSLVMMAVAGLIPVESGWTLTTFTGQGGLTGQYYVLDVTGDGANVSKAVSFTTDENYAGGDVVWHTVSQEIAGTASSQPEYAVSPEQSVPTGAAIPDHSASATDQIIIGAAGDDVLLGGAGNDLIRGGAGDDTIDGGDGDDTIYGDAGNDTIDGGAGDDKIYGGLGDDLIYGGAGNDTIEGGDGTNTIHGGDGNDVITGGAGVDTIYGDAGNDTIHGGDGNDLIYGGLGDDLIYGDAGDDTIEGGDGTNEIHGGDGKDVITGGAGVDTIYGDAGDDTIHGGGGNDLIHGGLGDDLIYGDAGDDTIHGDDGNDTIHGGDGNDVIFGDAGNDTIYGGAGDDVITGGAGDDILSGGAGADTFVYTGITDGHDVITGFDASEDTIDLDALFAAVGAGAQLSVEDTSEGAGTSYTIKLTDAADASNAVQIDVTNTHSTTYDDFMGAIKNPDTEQGA